MVGLLRSDTVGGLVVAGVVFVGGGLVAGPVRLAALPRHAGRLADGRGSPPDEVRAMSRELARQQWLTAARFLVVLTGLYLLIALLLSSRDAALGAASLSAITAGGLGLLSWWQGTRDGG